MINAFKLQSLNNVYQYLQLCKKLRQPTWQKQVMEYHLKIRLNAPPSQMIDTLQKWVPLFIPVNVFTLHPEFQTLMAVNSMVLIQDNPNYLTVEQQKDLDWFYLALLQRWLKKHTDSKLVKNIATKHQSHLDTIEKLIETVMCSNPAETLLLKFTLPLENGEINNTTIDAGWVHLNNSLKKALAKHSNREIGYIKKLSLTSANPMFCGCLYITHVNGLERSTIIRLLSEANFQCSQIDYLAFEPLISKGDFLIARVTISENITSNLGQHSTQWKKENQRIKHLNTMHRDYLRLSLFDVLNPLEELFFQVRLDGPLLDLRHKKRFFSPSHKQ